MNNQFILQQIMNNPKIRNNPMAQNALQMYQNGDVKGLNEMANNITKENNIDLNKFTQKVKAKLSMLGMN